MATITTTITIAADQQQNIDALTHMATALGASVDVAATTAAVAVAVAAPPPPVIHATKAEALAAVANPPAATAGVLGPADMRVAYVGPTVRSPAVDELQAVFRDLSTDSKRSLIAEVMPLARPNRQSHTTIIRQAEAICQWVCSWCRGLDRQLRPELAHRQRARRIRQHKRAEGRRVLCVGPFTHERPH